jgi:hypothetical protein
MITDIDIDHETDVNTLNFYPYACRSDHFGSESCARVSFAATALESSLNCKLPLTAALMPTAQHSTAQHKHSCLLLRLLLVYVFLSQIVSLHVGLTMMLLSSSSSSLHHLHLHLHLHHHHHHLHHFHLDWDEPRRRLFSDFVHRLRFIVRFLRLLVVMIVVVVRRRRRRRRMW